VYDDEGEPFTVKYHQMGSMLLNEIQKQRQVIRSQRGVMMALADRLERDEQRLVSITGRRARILRRCLADEIARAQ
jgi:hypothetical protein